MPCGRYQKDRKEIFDLQGRPLVRCNDEIYYGSMEEPYVIRMQIKSKKDVNGTEIADKVTVQLMATDLIFHRENSLLSQVRKRDCSLLWILQTSGLKEPLQTKCNLTLNLRSNRFWLLRFFLYGERRSLLVKTVRKYNNIFCPSVN